MELASATINQQSKRPTQTMHTKDIGASVVLLSYQFNLSGLTSQKCCVLSLIYRYEYVACMKV